MAFVARRRRATSLVRTAPLEEATASVPAQMPGLFVSPESVQEVVVVPISEVIDRLPKEALSMVPSGTKTLVQVTPVRNVIDSEGPISFRVAAIQQACPHLFRPEYRVDPAALIHIPEHQVFLGLPRRHHLVSVANAASEAFALTSSTVTLPMNLSQPSGNGAARVPGVRPLTGPESGSTNEASYTSDDAPTVKVYPSASQMPAPRSERPSLPPTRPAAASGVALSPTENGAAFGGDGDGEGIAFNLRELLEGLPIATLGFDAQKIPANVTASLPIALLESQMASGEVRVSLGDVIAGCLEKYRPAFAKADIHEMIQLPIEELQKQLPPKTAMPPHDSPFQPAQQQMPNAENPFQAAPPVSDPAQSPFAQQASPFQSPFGQAPVVGGTEAPQASPFAAPGEVSPSPFAQQSAASPFTQAGQPDSSSPFGTPSANGSNGSPFATAASQQAPSASPFGAPPAAEQAPVSPFGAPAASPFGAPAAEQAPASPFGAPAASPFGAPVAEQAPLASPFGAPASPFGAPAAEFGAPAAEQAPAASPFGAPASPFGAPASPFGAPASPFGAPGAEQAPAASPFGAPVVEQAPAASPFGAPVAEQAPAASPFGAPAAEQAPAASPFGAPAAGQAPAASPFGAPAAEQAPAASPFGAPAAEQAPAASPFGAPVAEPFGAPAAEQAPVASPFGAPASPFGAPAAEQAPAASPFGAPAAERAPASSPSESDVSPFEPQRAVEPEVASPFGAPAGSNGSPFGMSSPAFGGPAESNGSPFGAPVAKETASPFDERQEAVPSPFGAQTVASDPFRPAVVENEADSPFGSALASQASPFGGAQPAPEAPLREAASALNPLEMVAPPEAPMAPVEAALAAQPASPKPGYDFGFEADPKQLLLRALFGVDTPLSVENVLDRLAQLEGLEACVLIEKQSGEVRASRGKDQGRTAAFEAQARQAHRNVISLAEDLNVTDAESFTLRTGQGAMSFFNASKGCLAVLQEEAAFKAGIRERLTLVTRELSEML